MIYLKSGTCLTAARTDMHNFMNEEIAIGAIVVLAVRAAISIKGAETRSSGRRLLLFFEGIRASMACLWMGISLFERELHAKQS